MSRLAIHLVLAGLLLVGVSVALAATWRVDDSGTVLSQAVVKMQWRRLVPGRGADHAVDGQLRAALRLNLAPWLNKSVRLYMGLADSFGPPVQAAWRTQGRLLAGSVRSGGRVLVYDGIVGAPVLEETIDIALTTDGQALTQTQTLQFYFEVETQ